jgi:hypothetical protein
MDEYCRPVDKSDYGLNIQRIIETFRKIAAGELAGDISLLNYYKGIPINYPATILSIDKEFVEFATHPYQAIAILSDRSTFVKSSHFRHDLLAETFYVKVPEAEVSLKNFLFTRVLAEDRNYVRVALPEQRPVEVGFERNVLEGQLLDICLKSAAILLPPDAPISAGAIARLRLSLPMGEGNEEVSLQVLAKASLSTRLPDAARWVFDLQGDSTVEGRIARFIGHRQSEIVREIRETFWAHESGDRKSGPGGEP